MLRFEDLKTIGISYSRNHLSNLEKLGLFPRRRKLGVGPTGRVVWIKAEVDAWVRSRLNEVA
jgi:predicted DNA-binding transcriptional regulator AlpA